MERSRHPCHSIQLAKSPIARSGSPRHPCDSLLHLIVKFSHRSFASLVALTTALHLWNLAPACAETRTWRDDTGSHSVQAELIEVKDGTTAVLRGANGSIQEVPLARLSAEDRTFALAWQSRQSPKLPPAAVPSPAPEGEPEPEQKSVPWWEMISKPIDWKAGQEVFDRTISGASDSQKEKLRDLQWLSRTVPDDQKPTWGFQVLAGVAILLNIPAYIWLLVHEFRRSILWGVAQIAADIVGGCFAPGLGAVVAIFFAIGNFQESWRPILLNFITICLGITGLICIPSTVYSELDAPVKPKAEGSTTLPVGE